MARFNEILVGRYNRMLQKLLQMKGGPPAPQLAGEIQAALPLFSGVENRYLEGWDEYAIALTAPAVAAQNGGARIRNPSGSNIIAVIERVSVTSLAADQPVLGSGASGSDLGTIVSPTNARRDVRGRSNFTLIASTGNTALFNSKQQMNSGPTIQCEFIWFENQEYPLLPGDALQVSSNVVNQLIIVNFLWRERFLEESERT